MTDEAIAAMAGPAALPRQNGELVFVEPWEGRAFGLAVALSEVGAYDWDAFRQKLIAEIDRGKPDDGSRSGSRYYERWLASLERLLVDSEMISAAELTRRGEELAAHDKHEHDHDHVHDDDHS